MLRLIDKLYENIFFRNNYFLIYFFTFISIVLIGFFGFFTFSIRFNEVYKSSGLIVSGNQRLISTNHKGVIRDNNIKIGKVYQKGELILSFDNTLKENEIKQYTAQLELLKARIKGLIASNEALIAIEEYKVRIYEIENKIVENQLIIDNNTLTAPVESVLIESSYEGYLKGFIDEGTVVAKLIPVNNYIIKVKVTDNWVDRIKIGQKAKITLNNEKYDGEVQNILLENEYNVYAYIVFDHKNSLKITGISVVTEIIINEKISVIEMIFKAFHINK